MERADLMAVERQILEERIQLPVTPALNAMLRRFSPRSGETKGTVIMLHGLMQDSSIFLDEQGGGGLAYFLAEQGYDVFIAEWRGRDVNNNQLKRENFGLRQLLTEDLPLIWRAVAKRRRHDRLFLVGFQFGCSLWSAFLVRNPQYASEVKGIIHFAPQRQLLAVGRLKVLRYQWLEQGLLKRLARLLGYTPTKALHLGRVNESADLYQDYLHWQTADWKDAWDNFDYKTVAAGQYFPPSLYFVPLKQRWHGLEHDCRAFMFEQPYHNGRMIKLGAKVGNQQDYNLLDLCRSVQAEQDYYPLLLKWLKEISTADMDRLSH
ncbi:Serine aminopeptidase, S33 [Oceanospirillum multiglobuliferum]|nr:alpha/beta hydrolase [Oceanospirillum multiglobuliferum]SJZ40401.1 Serine aminopeptidase, S33 [Oceanospirillum multiglobuliferum]